MGSHTTATHSPCRPHTPCSLKAAALRLWTNSLVKNSRAHRTRSVQLAQVWLPCPEILGPVSKSSLVSRLTIRSSRVRFAASSRCGKLVHLAAAATLLGLAQALAGARSGFTRLSSRVKSHDSPASRSPGKNQRPVARAACRPGPSARMGRLWLQPHKEHIKAGHPANISFKPSPLRGLEPNRTATGGPA